VVRHRLFACALAAVAAAAAAALEIPPTPRTYLTDAAGAIPPDQSARVEQELAALENRFGHQLIAVFLPALEGESLEDFTMRCAERWKVGRKQLDDGIIFFAFVADHRMRLEVGYGLEDKVPDALAHRLLDEQVRPAFARGDYAAGVVSLTHALGNVFSGEAPPPPRRRSDGSFGFVAVLVLFALLSALGRRRRGFFLPGVWGGFGGSGGWSSGGFSAGGGSFGGGGASGSW
jgi:uncharacterized protein